MAGELWKWLLGNLANNARFPHFHSSGDEVLFVERRKTARKNLRAVEKWKSKKQDFHFPTAPMSLRRKERIISKTTQNQKPFTQNS